MCPPHSLRQRRTHIHLVYLPTRLRMLWQRQSIRHNQPIQLTVLDHLDGRSAQETMRHDSNALFSALLLENGGRQSQRAARVGNIVDQYRGLARHVAYQYHPAYLVCYLALFVDDGEVNVEAVGDCGGSIPE